MNEVSPFDLLAPTYDADFTDSNIGGLQRERVWLFLQKLLSTKEGPLRILEINCGTGNDALRLAAAGHTVIASDASAAMIIKAKEKLAISGSGLEVDFVVCSFSDLPWLSRNGEFDLVFSNFGGLNCIDHKALGRLTKNLYSITRPGAHLFFVVMGRCCLWEIFYYSIKGKFGTAFRKFKKYVKFTANGATMTVCYYSPHGIKKIYKRYFSFLEQHPVGLFIPPSYLEERFQLRPHWLKRLNSYERKFGYSFLSLFADHFCITFKKPVT
ncbi:MAG: class I SAM-dependent methyltransferase [Ginsengibacter sp.]